ncbi:hypothetical protein EW145_g3938 [Phellinidium pouzarii]|uniref:Major facilitator superfamily (MFS) profile domain-containing protein n=1 Tax=Phellinidium pouzarii TaxID=167371 RepID=A0A4S4L5K0_9AGAM|nr:hypothetical protein EW145_g3938 [Phellinidium pouzarii]
MAAGHTRPADEETPLLRPSDDNSHDHKKLQATEETPIPWAQFSLVLFLQLAEPLTSQVIYPFVPQLIREIGITHGDETKVGYYVGMMQSIFFATQALTVFHWSRISDCVGRKPVILIGLFGLSLSMYCFGISRSFAGLVVSRSLSGALNGNIGVIKSLMGEMTDSTNVARAFAYQPIAWSSGATIGPLIGGALSHPADRFPNVFGGSEYPYALPCAIPATFSVVAWIVTFLFLKETNQTGFSFRSLFSFRFFFWHARPTTPTLKLNSDLPAEDLPSAPALRTLFTPPVLLSTTVYALLSFIDIAYRAIQPVFYSTPRSLGGLGLQPHDIGSALALLGIANGVFSVAFFARLIKRWGTRLTYLIGIASAVPIFILFPVISAVVRAEERGFRGGIAPEESLTLSVPLLLLCGTQLGLTLPLNMCYNCVFMYITAAASTTHHYSKTASGSASTRPPMSSSSSSATLFPTSRTHFDSARVASTSTTPVRSQGKGKKFAKGKGKSSLGAVNGLAQCTVSVMRCVGPYFASALYAKGLALEYGNDAYEPPEGVPGSPIFEDSPGVPGGMVWRRLGGHDGVYCDDRICLRYARCGRETPGGAVARHGSHGRC